VKYPPRKLQGLGYSPISITEYQRFSWLREQLKKEGFNITLPSSD
jgi:hypothetical protein